MNINKYFFTVSLTKVQVAQIGGGVCILRDI